MQAQTIKEAAHRLIDDLPDDATWRDLVYRGAPRASIVQGLSEDEAGLLFRREEIERALGIGA